MIFIPSGIFLDCVSFNFHLSPLTVYLKKKEKKSKILIVSRSECLQYHRGTTYKPHFLEFENEILMIYLRSINQYFSEISIEISLLDIFQFKYFCRIYLRYAFIKYLSLIDENRIKYSRKYWYFIRKSEEEKKKYLGKIPSCDSFMECRFSRIRIERSFGPYRIELIVISSELDNELPLKVRPCSYKPHNRLL